MLACAAVPNVLAIEEGSRLGENSISRNLLLQIPMLLGNNSDSLDILERKLHCELGDGCVNSCSEQGYCQHPADAAMVSSSSSSTRINQTDEEGTCLCNALYWGRDCSAREYGRHCGDGFQFIKYELYDSSSHSDLFSAWQGSSLKVFKTGRKDSSKVEEDMVLSTTMCSGTVEKNGFCAKVGGVYHMEVDKDVTAAIDPNKGMDISCTVI